MDFKAVSNVVTSKISRQVLKLQKHSPVILFAAGIVGVVGTAILASKATLKLDEVLKDTKVNLDDAHNMKISASYTEQDRQQDMLIIYAQATVKVARLYAPAFAVATLTVAALTSSHVVLTKRNMALTAAYAALDKGWREYRQRVVDEFGIEKERDIRYAIKDHQISVDGENGVELQTIKQIGGQSASVYAVLFDEACGSSSWRREPGYNQLFLSAQQNYANDLLRARGHVFLNDVYDLLGVPRTRAGSVVGWIYNPDVDYCGDGYIDFGIFDGDRRSGMRFVQGHHDSVLLDFNVDGVIWDKI